ncbi:hypothetical protein BDZ89DRAFT_338925 [Hymenopellis radicata]|nr:hypothetical protein BDZ89DRAFT_338925 [Hymenopellis radicata]
MMIIPPQLHSFLGPHIFLYQSQLSNWTRRYHCTSQRAPSLCSLLAILRHRRPEIYCFLSKYLWHSESRTRFELCPMSRGRMFSRLEGNLSKVVETPVEGYPQKLYPVQRRNFVEHRGSLSLTSANVVRED